MTVKCNKCGALLPPDSKFCTLCGTAVEAPVAQPQAGFCQSCGAPLLPGARFCSKCRAPVGQPSQAPQPQGTAPGSKPGVLQVPRQAADLARSALGDRITASQNVGEMVLGELSPAGGAVQALTAGSPMGALFSAVPEFLKGIFGSLLKPWKLILAALMAGLWIFLDKYQASENIIIKVLSFLTFAKGGTDRANLAAALGGYLGKGTVAVALGSLLTGGVGKAVRGIGAAFEPGEKKSIPGAIIGAALGAGLYLAFAGLGGGTGSIMAGAAGALLCLENAGSQSGWFYKVAGAFTAKAQDGVRQVQNGKAASMLAGMALGFAAAAAVMAVMALR